MLDFLALITDGDTFLVDEGWEEAVDMLIVQTSKPHSICATVKEPPRSDAEFDWWRLEISEQNATSLHIQVGSISLNELGRIAVVICSDRYAQPEAKSFALACTLRFSVSVTATLTSPFKKQFPGRCKLFTSVRFLLNVTPRHPPSPVFRFAHASTQSSIVSAGNCCRSELVW